MRNLILIGFIFSTLPFILAMPHLGVYLWTWISVMSPHRFVYGFGEDLPFNFIVTVVTLASLALHGDSWRVILSNRLFLYLLLVVLFSLTTLTSLSPDISQEIWSRTLKSMFLGLVVLITMTNRARVDGMIWVIVISLGFFGVKGGGFTILTGGGGNVYGPPQSPLADNNQLALGLCVVLPLIYYLFAVTRNSLLRLGLVATFILTVVAIFGTYSRGGLIGISVTMVLLWLRSSHRVVILCVALVAILSASMMLPQRWYDRMTTIGAAREGQDASFNERVQAWGFAVRATESHPLTGTGFSASEDTSVWMRYVPNIEMQGSEVRGRAMHSIYFQTLSDHGAPALIVTLLLWFLTWRDAGRIARHCRDHPDLAWAGQLAAALQVSLSSYLVAGSALSMAYWDVMYILVCLVMVLRHFAFFGARGQFPARARLDVTAPKAVNTVL